MSYLSYDFPHTRNQDSDLRQILEMYMAVKNLPNEWAAFKKETIERLKIEVKNYLEVNLEDLIDEFVYDVSYDGATETIYYIRRKENTNG